MTFFTQDILKTIIGDNNNLSEWFESLSKILPQYDINTPERIAAFISQCAHESGNFARLNENLNYSAEALQKVWPRHFPNKEIAEQYARQPEKIANRAYANRMGNGDESSGDGWKYRGRGLIQLTGFTNYSAFATDTEKSVDEVVTYLQTISGAVESACWFWKKNNLNQLADQQDIVRMTKKINGGTNGLEDRKLKFNKAAAAFGFVPNIA